ncbi:hypothetical protein [Campylobacter sp. FOBRC14]|uniref:hypothetical protein n=1 Tax=Campylobacter sp. FOBRC14 TaxID=936554 RepID=UPI00027A34DC|nr:hypothetical protein [Campylobacter sp. FOBRC14]EJP75048.1 hypothetical protein HMPREF1139_1481 [Campylobacter sp. FOBRC14]
MPAIYAALAWLFKKLSLGELAGFILRKVAFTKIVAIEIAMFALMITYFGTLIYVANFLFGFLFDLLSNLKNLISNGGSNEVSYLAVSLFSALGVSKALVDVLNLCMPIFISLFLLIGLKVGIKLFEKLRSSIVNFVGFIK